jgi:hypothetical protein
VRSKTPDKLGHIGWPQPRPDVPLGRSVAGEVCRSLARALDVWFRRSTTQGGLPELAWHLLVCALGLTLCTRQTVKPWSERNDHD